MNIRDIHHVYFIGIGGIGMSAIARYFLVNGKSVAGYDKTPTTITSELISLGAAIHFNDAVRNIPMDFLSAKNTLVIYTPAIPENHKEFNYFKENDFTILKRAAILGKITEATFSMAVAGTHGKTTTSSILGHIMNAVNATSFLGGIAENYQSNLILGEDKISVVEADEFDRSFLQLSPNIACITSMDADHLDIYEKAENLHESFYEFSEKVTDTLIVAKGLPMQGITYAVEEDADYFAYNLRYKDGYCIFDAKTPTTIISDIKFALPGKHNIMNAMAALAMANVYGISIEDIKEQLGSFKGVQRRFSYKIKQEHLVLIDDYAHHPTEIEAVEASIRTLYPEDKVMVIFQPHLFSRTRDFMAEFAEILSRFDEVRLLDIYPARELPIEGISSTVLLDRITNNNKKLIFENELVDEIRNSCAKVIAMLGAGDIGVMVNEVSENLIKETI